jgi:hypothetical protein
MKISLTSPRFWLLALGLALPVGAARAEMREFKSAQGSIIKAQLKKAKGQMIYLTTEAGKEIQVSLTGFAKEDQNYILKWMDEDPLAVDYNFVCKAEAKLLPATKTAANGYMERVSSQQQNYNVSVMNSCRNTLTDLSIDWCAFMLNRVTLSSSGSYSFSYSDTSPAGELRVKKGSESLPSLAASHTHTFVSPSFTLESVIDKYYTGAKKKDVLQGVWLRFYRGDTLVGEWKSPDCPKTEWPGGSHKSKASSKDVAKNDGEPAKKNISSKTPTPTGTSSKDGAPAATKDDDVGDIVKIFQLEDTKK